MDIRPCTERDVPLLAEREPAGADIAIHQFARQARGESVFLVAWEGQDDVGSAELTLDDDLPETSWRGEAPFEPSVLVVE